MNIDIFDDRVCEIGEGPFFDERAGRMTWVDILAGRVLWRSFDRQSADTGFLDIGAHVGAAVPTADGGMVLCLPDGLVLRDPDGRRRQLATYPRSGPATGPGASDPGAVDPGAVALRSNDAKADPTGRLWHGTMAYDERPGAGALYRLDSGPRLDSPPVVSTLVIDHVTVSNGLGWSPDGSTMYFADSPTGRVDMFDVDPDTGLPHRRRPFATVGQGCGVPDGLCVDAAGGVWVALWSGSAVHRYAPDGSLDRVVNLPTPQVTSCAFAGPDLDTLVITTAATGRTGDPAAGRTYLHRPVDVVGLPVDRYDSGGLID